MGEIILSAIVQNLVGKTSSLINQKVCLSWGLERGLERFEENLSIIKAVLLDAEDKQACNHELHLWLKRLKNFCDQADDVLDELEFEKLRKQVLKRYGNPIMKVGQIFSRSNPLIFRFEMRNKIKELSESLDEIASQKSKFHLSELVDFRPAVHTLRQMTDSFVLVSKVVGRDADKERMMKFLLQPSDKGVEVIPIVGIGGLGKTTLAKILYNDERIDQHFQLKMWVCISENGFDKNRIMVKMMNFFTKQNLSSYESEQTQIFIRDKLNGNKFLLVIDDVWGVNRNEWVDLADLLGEGKSGSKIILTTRSNSVAEIVDSTLTYKLEALPDEDCFSLFKKIAFRAGEYERYPNLLEIGKDIVRKCKGVPLAIRTLGALLYAKNNVQDWIFIRDNDIWKLEQSKGDILPILKLSYDQLPSHLKPCFSICSIFPKDFRFSSQLLTPIWMAHGLLQSSNGNEELEDIGLQYTKELCSRSLFQFVEEFGDTWAVRVHDLVHDLGMSVAHNECMVVNERNMNVSEGTRHISFSNVNGLLDIDVPKSLRTIFSLLFTIESRPAAQFVVDKFISRCTHVRMLDLSGISFEVLPNSIGSLKHLRYLNLSNNHILKKLPRSLWKLHNLQTLILADCVKLEELPRDVRKLISLRSLTVTTKQKKLPKDGLGNLRCLHTLVVENCCNVEVLFEGTPNPTSLRFLAINSCSNLISLAPNLKYFAAVETLMILDCARLNFMEVDDIEDIEFRLQVLLLVGLPLLMTLPQWLQRSSKTLQCMYIVSCENLSSLPEWLPTFMSLEKLSIANCPKLSTLPEGMHHLTTLESLEIKGCPSLSERYKRNTGEDWHKIAHIPDIEIN